MRKLTAAEKRGLLEVATWIERRGHCYVMRRTYLHHHPITVEFMVDRLRKVVPEAVLLDTTDKYRYGEQSWLEVRFRTPLTARLRAMLCVAPTTGSDRSQATRRTVQNC